MLIDGVLMLTASEDIKMDGRSSMLPDSILVQLPDECEARTLFALPVQYFVCALSLSK
jgi:hypothetical protein